MQTILAVLGSAGLFSLIQFLIARHDNKNTVLTEIKKDMGGIKDTLVRLDEKIDINQASSARRKILAAADELKLGITMHSEEWYNQLNEDIDEYERYCEDHPKYRNTKATQSISYIKQNYARRLEQNDFLR